MTKKKSKTSKVKEPRRNPKRLSHVLYSYVENTNGVYAREYGKKHFGSFSAYLDILIQADRKEHFSAAWIKITPKNKVVRIRRKTSTASPETQAA